jgi:hypothetical protein
MAFKEIYLKFMLSAIIEFIRPEDANKIIDEELIWQGEVV